MLQSTPLEEREGTSDQPTVASDGDDIGTKADSIAAGRSDRKHDYDDVGVIGAVYLSLATNTTTTTTIRSGRPPGDATATTT